MSEPVDLPEHGESGLVFVLIFEDLRYYCRVHSAFTIIKNHSLHFSACFDGFEISRLIPWVGKVLYNTSWHASVIMLGDKYYAVFFFLQNSIAAVL